MSLEILEKIQNDYPNFVFRTGKKFMFRPPKTIIYEDGEDFEIALLLHEVGHALLRHRNFRMDAERVKMEVAAWEKAKELANNYSIQIDEDLIQDELDTYRDWLHKKSRCPKCGLTRYQTPDGKYHCPNCELFTVKKKHP